jgi:hypothetical protein
MSEEFRGARDSAVHEEDVGSGFMLEGDMWEIYTWCDRLLPSCHASAVILCNIELRYTRQIRRTELDARGGTFPLFSAQNVRICNNAVCSGLIDGGLDGARGKDKVMRCSSHGRSSCTRVINLHERDETSRRFERVGETSHRFERVGRDERSEASCRSDPPLSRQTILCGVSSAGRQRRSGCVRDVQSIVGQKPWGDGIRRRVQTAR